MSFIFNDNLDLKTVFIFILTFILNGWFSPWIFLVIVKILINFFSYLYFVLIIFYTYALCYYCKLYFKAHTFNLIMILSVTYFISFIQHLFEVPKFKYSKLLFFSKPCQFDKIEKFCWERKSDIWNFNLNFESSFKAMNYICFSWYLYKVIWFQ